jgi:lipopolysaccharide/colanic/teichoic acid biosynthesis glycosyltransferase
MAVDPQELRMALMANDSSAFRYGSTKRGLDIVLSSLALVLLAPLLGFIALSILFDGGGSVIYRQKRHGLGRSEFTILKFRTLVVSDGDDVFRQVTSPDDGVTRVGRFLRAWNLDELPQLWNVLRGEMSLVGPRPHPLRMDEHYEGVVPFYAGRYAAKPGLTGWAQVNGNRGPTPLLSDIQARLDHDLHYIENQSLWLDLKIMAMTVFSATAFRNAF